MAELTENSVLSSLDAAFGDAVPPPMEKPAPTPADQVEADAAALPPVDAPVADEAEAEPQEAAPVPEEPEYEVEVEGKREVVRGKDKVKELLQKGLHYSRNSEQQARAKEVLQAQFQQFQVQSKVQELMANDIGELRALDAALEQWSKVDWNAAYESDPFKALQWREQRDQLRERRNAKAQEFQNKGQQFTQAMQQAQAQMLRAEQEALVAKLPEWRNSETAQKEQQAIAKTLLDAGYTSGEVSSLMDHRAVTIARKAMLYDLHVANRDVRSKQMRDAPPTATPGAALSQQQKERAGFKQERAKLREFGSKGNHRAQEAVLERMLNRTFK